MEHTVTSLKLITLDSHRLCVLSLDQLICLIVIIAVVLDESRVRQESFHSLETEAVVVGATF